MVAGRSGGARASPDSETTANAGKWRLPEEGGWTEAPEGLSHGDSLKGLVSKAGSRAAYAEDPRPCVRRTDEPLPPPQLLGHVFPGACKVSHRILAPDTDGGRP